MRAGRLRHRLVIKKRNESTRDGYGQVVPGTTTDRTVYGAVEPLRGKELIDAAQVNARLTHKIVMRHVETLTPDMTIAFGTRNFNLVSAINVDERNIQTICMAQEILGTNTVTTTTNFQFMTDDNFEYMDNTNFDFMG